MSDRREADSREETSENPVGNNGQDLNLTARNFMGAGGGEQSECDRHAGGRILGI